MPSLVDHHRRRRFNRSLESLREGFYKPALMEAPITALLGQLKISPMKKGKVLKALRVTDPILRRNLGIPKRQAVLALAKRWNPIQGLISRHSRTLLQAYKQQGAMEMARSSQEPILVYSAPPPLWRLFYVRKASAN